MQLDGIKYVYFLGIGGIGMSALARYFKVAGKEVAGYDKTATPLTDELIAEGIFVHFDDNMDLVPKSFKSTINDQRSTILIVITPAVPSNHSEYQFFKNNGFTMKKRSEVLGAITKQLYTLAVAGTHGKTTTSSMLAHILKTAGIDCTAFLGGITQNYGTNLLLPKQPQPTNHKAQTPVVVEADEYDRSFLTLHPDVAVITSVDADHLDIYGDKKHMEESYSLFAGQVKKGGKLIMKTSVVKALGSKDAISYSLDGPSDFYAKNISITGGNYVYDIVHPAGVMEKMTLGLPGRHNVENSVAATAAASQLSIAEADIRRALASFRGVKRRFDYQIKTDKLVFIDDYAHHPEELRACISSVKEMYPGKKLTGIFQPHLYTRTRDFADGFAQSLDLLDETILLDIYPARELPIEGVSSQMLLDKMKGKNKSLSHKKELVNEVCRRKPEVLLTLGAGDIDTLVEPLKLALLKQTQLQ